MIYPCLGKHLHIYIYILFIYLYLFARPPPHDPHIWPREGVLGGGGLQTPDFQKKSGVPPDSRLQISRENLEYPQTPDSRFPEKIWSTSRLQTPDFQKKSGVPGPWTPDSGVCNLESGAAGTPDFFWKSGVWSLGPRVLQIFSGNLESGVGGPRYSRFFLEIWSLESGAPVLQIFSGNLESGAPVLQIFSGNLESGVRGPGTPDFLWKSSVWSPGHGYSRFFSGNLVFRV